MTNLILILKRYAGFLIKENIKIFNFLVTIFAIFIPLPIIISWPVLNMTVNEGFPRNQMKGILCTMTKLDFSSRETQATVSDKPKLVAFALGMFLHSYYFRIKTFYRADYLLLCGLDGTLLIQELQVS